MIKMLDKNGTIREINSHVMATRLLEFGWTKIDEVKTPMAITSPVKEVRDFMTITKEIEKEPEIIMPEMKKVAEVKKVIKSTKPVKKAKK